MYRFLLLIIIVSCVMSVRAQQPDTLPKTSHDTVLQRRDTTQSRRHLPKIKHEKVYHPDSLHNPHKALMRSLIIPGWGQLYNRQWWKVPIIYGGLGLLGDAIVFNEQNYKVFLKEAQLRERGILSGRNPQLATVSDADVTTYLDIYRRNRDLCILGTVGAWGIQMIDAYIDAKFKHSYTMDNKLSLNIRPGLIGNSPYALSPGMLVPALRLTFTLR